MSSGLSFSAILLSVLLAAGAVAASDAAAQQPARSCSGTLCDLYYGSPSPDDPDKPPPKPAAPTPLYVPNGNILGFFSGGNAQQPGAPGSPAAPAARPLIGVGGGGLAAMARGAPAERCTGTFCDFYYGGPPPETPGDKPAAGGAEAQPAAEPAADTPDADEAPPPRRRRVEVEEQPRCVAPAGDPWKCYR